MKKTYVTPQMETMVMDTASLLSDSKSVTGPDGIGYGGVDEDGTKDPASRRFDVWNDDEFF